MAFKKILDRFVDMQRMVGYRSFIGKCDQFSEASCLLQTFWAEGTIPVLCSSMFYVL